MWAPLFSFGFSVDGLAFLCALLCLPVQPWQLLLPVLTIQLSLYFKYTHFFFFLLLREAL